MNKEEKSARKVLEKAERCIDSDDAGEARKKLEQVMQTARKLGSQELVNEIFRSRVGKYFSYVAKTQSIELSPIKTDGFILDVGGGGEGIIGKLNGKQVVAIDTSEQELRETENEALKIVMDASGLKFLPESFGVCTAFFSLMYFNHEQQSETFKEAYRVLKVNGRFLIWDVEIPRKRRDYIAFSIRLGIKLPNEDVKTGYGVRYKVQDIGYFKELARTTGFRTASEWRNDGIFYLELLKV
jgi:ubiquinone/menaquinone biosynthesis C-methylase UbiE